MDKLPTSDDLTVMLLQASQTAAELQDVYIAAYNSVRIARLNRDLIRSEVVAMAYAEAVSGKNAEMRSAELDHFLLHHDRLQSYEASLRQAERDVKQAEAYIEAARVHRSALHNLVDLRVAELGVVAATAPRQSRPRRKKEEQHDIATNRPG